jgi:hypothetical protein
MRKTVLTILGALLIVGSAVQMAAAAERDARKVHRGPVSTSQQFRNAKGSSLLPSEVRPPSTAEQYWSDYADGHVISAPAGR